MEILGAGLSSTHVQCWLKAWTCSIKSGVRSGTEGRLLVSIVTLTGKLCVKDFLVA